MTAFEEFQKQRLGKKRQHTRLYPKRCYKTIYDGENDVIVLEDSKERGYMTSDRCKVLEIPELLLVAKELRRFQAIYFALKDKDPDVLVT